MYEVDSYNMVLKEYFDGEHSVAANMLNRGCLTRAAKTAGYAGKEKLIDQSMY